MIPYIHFLYLELGPVKIYTWGFFISLGFLAATLFLIKKYPQDKEHFINILLWALVGSIVGARLFFAAFYDKLPLADILKIWQGGMSSFGGFFGGAAAIFIYCRLKRLNLYLFFEKIAFALPLGIAVTRIGCSLINDHPGVKTIAMPLSVAYPDGSRFDLGFLEMLFAAAIFFYFLAKRKGGYLEMLLLIYGTGRFLMDFLRIGDMRYAGLTPAQYGSIIMIVAGVYLIIKNKRNYEFLG